MIDSLGDRMKEFYEGVTKTPLVRRMPVIIRIDGRHFSSFTRGFQKPFDEIITGAMNGACWELMKDVQNCKFIYTQSDEISLLLVDYNNLETDAWFGNDIQKIVSISASLATIGFNKTILHSKPDLKNWAQFDARAFNIPREEVSNYFVWRQQDCLRNSVSVTAQSMFSAKQLHGKNTPTMKQMMVDKGYDWSIKTSQENRNGRYIQKDSLSVDPAPRFTDGPSDRQLIEQYIYPEEIAAKGAQS
jgi:tRNA(His) guanylyltransferase